MVIGVVKGTKYQPKSGAKALQWDEKDAKAFGTIALTLHDRFIHYLWGVVKGFECHRESGAKALQ